MESIQQRTVVEGWLKDLSAALNIDLSLDEEGVCTLQVGPDNVTAIEVFADVPIIQMYTPLLSIQKDDPSKTFSLAMRSLEINAFQSVTRGGAVALAPGGSLLIYCLSIPIEGVDSEIFSRMLGDFYDTSEQIKALLNNQETIDPSEKEFQRKIGPFIKV